MNSPAAEKPVQGEIVAMAFVLPFISLFLSANLNSSLVTGTTAWAETAAMVFVL